MFLLTTEISKILLKISLLYFKELVHIKLLIKSINSLKHYYL
jgi:hypothetical protein